MLSEKEIEIQLSSQLEEAIKNNGEIFVPVFQSFASSDLADYEFSSFNSVLSVRSPMYKMDKHLISGDTIGYIELISGRECAGLVVDLGFLDEQQVNTIWGTEPLPDTTVFYAEAGNKCLAHQYLQDDFPMKQLGGSNVRCRTWPAVTGNPNHELDASMLSTSVRTSFYHQKPTFFRSKPRVMQFCLL